MTGMTRDDSDYWADLGRLEMTRDDWDDQG